MSLAARLAVPFLAAIPLVSPPAARAQSPADAAAALQTQVRAWITDLAGPDANLGARDVQVTSTADGFRFVLPVGGPVGDTGWSVSGDPVTAMVKPLDGDRWAIESLRLPSPMRADGPGQDGKPPSWALKLADQDIRGVFDPSLATASSLDAALRGYTSIIQTEDGSQTTHFDRYVWHGGWQPLGDGRVTVSGEGRGENLSIGTDMSGGPGHVLVTAAVARSSGRAERVAFDRLAAAVRSLTGLMPALLQAAGDATVPDDLSPTERAGLRSLVTALRDLLGGVQADTTLENVKLEADGQGGTLARLFVGGRAAAPSGLLDASMRVEMEGFDSALIPKGPLRDYVPRHITVAPHLSGVPADEFVSLLLRALDMDDPSSLEGEAWDLLAKGPVTAGVDELVFDLGPAGLKATGSVTVAGPDDISGSARVLATGLDALIRRANTVPDLRSVAPVLIFLKGIGDQKGDATVWNVTYADGRAEVNGTDLNALLSPGDAASDPPRKRKP